MKCFTGELYLEGDGTPARLDLESKNPIRVKRTIDQLWQIAFTTPPPSALHPDQRMSFAARLLSLSPDERKEMDDQMVTIHLHLL